MDFRQPVCRALTTDILLAYGARTPVILNSTLCAISVLSLNNLYLAIVFIITHSLIIYATNKDPKFFDTFKNYAKYDEFYDS